MKLRADASFALLGTGLLVGCAIHKPCTEAGDVSWPTQFKGDRVCRQKEIAGKIVNHGQYIQKFPSGKTAVEGDFNEGRKNGLWIQFDEAGNRVLEKYFENGVEKSQPNATPAPKAVSPAAAAAGYGKPTPDGVTGTAPR